MDHVAVSTEGMHLRAPLPDEPVDVRFDDAWLWSFNPGRDAETAGSERLVRWPAILRPYLRGRSTVALVGHTSDTVLFEAEVAFTDADDRVRVVDEQGHPLGVDKGGRLQRRFDDTDPSLRDHIVATVEQILADLREEAGLDAFLAFGCLLGAVRSGSMIGHDADADVAYLSKHAHPLDIIRENRAAARTMRELGYTVVPMSGADFKIWVPLPDGRRCGVDVFCGYFLDDHFYLLPSVQGRIDRSSLLPTSTVTLEGRELVAPARPEDLLTVTYGPHWRTPDPAFKFAHPTWVTRHMNGYWRGARNRLRHWTSVHRAAAPASGDATPPGFARWVHRQIGGPANLVDVGAGTGRDAVWFAGKGHTVLALDYSNAARSQIRALAERRGVDVDVDALNLFDVRSVLSLGARLAHEPAPRHVYARGMIDELSPAAREELFRFAAMVSRHGGLTFLQFKITPHSRPEQVIGQIEARGGTVESVRRPGGGKQQGKANKCRLVVRWA